MIRRNGVTMYDGTPEDVSRETYESILSKTLIPRGLFYDTKYNYYLIHKVDSNQFAHAEHLNRYSLIGVYNRDTRPTDIQEDIEAL